ERGEDVPLHVLAVWLTGHSLDQQAEQIVGGVVVQEVRARLEVKRLVLEQREHLRGRQVERFLCAKRRNVGEVAYARRMGEQLSDGDVSAVRSVFRHETSHVVLETELLVLG